MPEIEADLLIGGMTLYDLHGQLDWEALEIDSSDWLLAGRLELDAQDEALLQLGRRYRLQLADGRAGQVVIAKIQSAENSHIIAEFQPTNTPNKPR